MNEWEKALVFPDTSILEVIEVIDKNSLQIAIVVDTQKKILGMVTDGDIRRAILKNISLSSKVERIMTRHFSMASIHDSREAILERMQRLDLRHMPIVNDEECIVDLKNRFQLTKTPKLDNLVILMAGGQGTRLRPLTEDCPKPLLKIGNKPLLETIIENFRDYGLYNFIITVNYRANLIEEYFENGSRWGVDINYLREKKELGTAGSLSILPEKPVQPLIVMNGDLLTKVNFKNLIEYHCENGSAATMCVRDHDYQVPYGVIKGDGPNLIGLEEKPVKRFFVNAGIYVLEPDTLDFIPKNIFFNMTTLFEKLIHFNKKVTIFPVHEYWLDIGQKGDYERANGDFHEHF